MRIALFGGSFNPIHCGHLSLAGAVLGSGLADEVWLMISPQNPLKPAAGLLPECRRLELARRALQAASIASPERAGRIVASDYEFSLPRPTYTYATLRALRRDRPADRFSLLVGADNWACFSRWSHPEEIRAHHPLIVYPRLGYPLEQSILPDGVTLLTAPLLPVSSTQIRARAARGESLHGLVPACIEQDVRRLYGPHCQC